MKRRFSEEQIIRILKDREAGHSTAEICRQHGISQTTFFKWKAKFGGINVSDALKLKNGAEAYHQQGRLMASFLLMTTRFPLSHAPDYGGGLSMNPAALH